jgi:type III secretory pathway component EscS
MSATEILHEAFRVILFGTAPALLAAVAVGILVGVLQSVTQIQDQSIGYVTKLAAVCLVLLVMSRWLMQTLDQLFDAIYGLIPGLTTGPL